jgi:formamidopyrimidine-DNA glycosylase
VPELPEVEAVRRELQPVMEQARFVAVAARRPDLRTAFPSDFAERLIGHTVHALNRRGKYLLAELSSREVLIMHLGMSGSFRVESFDQSDLSGDFSDPRSVASKHDHVVFAMSSGVTVVFNDPRRFGFMDVVSQAEISRHPALRVMGLEPLTNEFDAAALARACRGKKTSLKAALSDQRVVAGLGNIYVCEALHRAHLSPKRRASTIATTTGLPKDPAVRLVKAIKKVLNDAVLNLDASFRVYDREGARCRTAKCPGTVKRIVQSGRSTFYCPVCQR